MAYAKTHGFNPPPAQDYAAGVMFAKQHHGAVNAEALQDCPDDAWISDVNASPAASFSPEALPALRLA
jgi:hypothetical protein